MKDWCSKNQKEGNLNGFAIYAYSLVLKSSENVLQSFLYKTTCEDFHETVIVYQPTKQVIFLIRMAMGKDLEDEIKLSTNDMVKFVLTFFDVLGKSGLKLINLLVTGEEFIDYQSKCESCKHQMISIKLFTSSKSFDEWWEKKENKFSISVIHSDLNNSFLSDFLSRLVTLVNSTQLNYSIEQVTEATVMTPEQTRIVYLPRKHLLIKGCSGSGKTVVAYKRAEIISRSLTKDDNFYYIICDSRGMFKEERQYHSKINVFYNIKQEPKSAILEQILQSDSKRGKLNVTFDAFYGESLEETEARKLNQAFKTNGRLKYSNVVLIAQPLIRESAESGTRKERSMFEILETMNPPEELNYNVGNPMEIKRRVASGNLEQRAVKAPKLEKRSGILF